MLAVAALVAVLFLTFVAALAPVGCEDADAETTDNVLCDPRGSTWDVVQGVLMLAATVGVVAGGVASTVTRRMRWLAIAAVAAVPAFIAVFAIYDIDLEDEKIPRFGSIRLESRVCPRSCTAGIPLEFTLSDPARVSFLVTWDSLRPPPPPLDHQSGQSGERVLARGGTELERVDSYGTVYEFPPGRHAVAVTGKTGRLPPGPYRLEANALVAEDTNQRDQSRGTVTLQFRSRR